MNVGVLGAGFMGGTHARSYAQIPGVKVVAVSSRNLEKAAKLAAEVGAAPTADAMAIFADPTIEAVSIAVPTHLHKQLTLAAIKAGKHVLLEKPFALDVADCDAMIAAQEESDTFLMIGHTLRFWPEYVALVNFVHSGALGRPLSAVASRLSQRPAWSDWFGKPEQSGGAVIDLMIHDLDTLNWIFGHPVSVYACGQQSAPGMWDHMLTVVNYGAAAGSIEGSELLPPDYPFTMTLSVLCERGRVEYAFRAGGVSVEMGGGVNSLIVYEPGKAYTLDASGRGSDAWGLEVAYFVECVRAGRAPEVGTPQQARLAVAMANAARMSLETMQVIQVTD
jgi:predicted dehydrogenase